jgi:hypothetical protein
MENNSAYTVTDPSLKTKKIPKYLWLIGGCGCLLIIGLIIAGVLVGVFGSRLFGGGDPIASVAPGDTLVYVNIDLVKLRSEELANIADVFQEIAETEKKQTPLQTMDEAMSDEYGMSFTNDVMPWIGQYGAFMIVGGNFQTGDLDYLVVIEARNKKSADEFITKFTSAMEDKQATPFDISEEDGLKLYIHRSDYSKTNDIVICRAGKYIYYANSKDTIVEAANRKKNESLGNVAAYKNAMKSLPKDRIASIYLSGDIYSEFSPVLQDEIPYYLPSDMGLAGMAFSISAIDEGLRSDIVVAYDPEKMDDFEKESLKAKYNNPKAIDLLPGDTFFFLGANSSLSPGRILQDGSPLYTQDYKEALDLITTEYGIDVQELFNLLSGEIALGIGPAHDGLLAQTGISMGMTILASTDDEDGFNAWIDDVLNAVKTKLLVTYDTKDVDFGKYRLQEFTMPDIGQNSTLLFYGVDNGYFILGTSEDMLDKGLNSKDTLSDNEIFRETWKAFPSGSVPYLYLNTTGLLDSLSQQLGLLGADFDVNRFDKIPVLGISLNQTKSNTRSLTIIIFVDTGK